MARVHARIIGAQPAAIRPRNGKSDRAPGQWSVDRDEMRVPPAPVESPKRPIHFRSGGSPEIDVHQPIERMVFRYKTPALARERATVQVWARA